MADKKSAAFAIVMILLIGMIVLFVILILFTQPEMTVHSDDQNIQNLLEHSEKMAWWSTIALVMMPVIMLLIILGVYLFLTKREHDEHVGMSHLSALDILNERYARGELKKEQYDAMRKELKL